MPTQRDARLTLQRAWRSYAGLNNRRSTCKLVSRMDTLRTEKQTSASVKTTAFFRTYLTRLVCLCARVLKQNDLLALFTAKGTGNTKHILDVLILGVVAGSKVARALEREAVTKRLWDAFEAAHLYLNAQLSIPKGALLPKALALEFITAANDWLKTHAALERFKQTTASAAVEWSRVTFMQRVHTQVADRLERAFLTLHGVPCTPVTEADLAAAAAFHPLPDPSVPIFSMPSRPLLPETLHLFSCGNRLREEQVVHATLLDPEFPPLPASLPLLSLTSTLYTRIPHATRTEIEQRIARHALWLTLEQEMQVGDYRRALAVYATAQPASAAAAPSLSALDVPMLKALVDAKETQCAAEFNAFVSEIKARVLQDDQGCDYERALFHLRQKVGNPLALKGTLAWLLQLMPSLSLASLQGMAACNTVALKEAHAFTIVASLMYPHLLMPRPSPSDTTTDASPLIIETLVHDLPLFKSLSVAFAALVDSFKCSLGISSSSSSRQTIAVEPHQEVIKFLVWEALETTSASNYRDLLYSLDDWGLTSRVCNLVRINASVHWDIYQHLLAYAAQQYLAYHHHQASAQ